MLGNGATIDLCCLVALVFSLVALSTDPPHYPPQLLGMKLLITYD